MRIAIITGSYPQPNRPVANAFVQQFAWAMARLGHECAVINPISVLQRRYGRLPIRFAQENAGNGKWLDVYRPRYFSFSSKNLRWVHTGRWTQWTLNRVAVNTIKHMKIRPEIVYGHFLYNAGRAAVVVGETLGIPSVASVGEGAFWTVDPFGFERAKRDFSSATGFLAVATHIRDGLVEKIGVPREKVIIEPNGVDLAKFYPGDSHQARSKLGLSPGIFLIVFVGTFDHLKGGVELVAAVDGLKGINIAMIGHGEINFQSNNIIYQGLVSHQDVPGWLNAADLFVPPTREEGSCNAVIEAMGCGVPIVTSNGNYMDDIVDDAVAVRVDPTDVGAIQEAILALKNNPERRRKMSEACIKKAKNFDINKRACRVTAWMQELIRNYRR